MSYVTKEELHRLVDQLPDGDTGMSEAVTTLLRAPDDSIRKLRAHLGAQRILIPSDGGAWLADLGGDRLVPIDPVLQAFAAAPLDDEPWTTEDEAAAAEARVDQAARLRATPWAEVKAELGLD